MVFLDGLIWLLELNDQKKFLMKVIMMYPYFYRLLTYLHI